MACRQNPTTGRTGRQRGLDVNHTRTTAADSTRKDLENLHYQIYERLYKSLESLGSEDERRVNDTYHQRLQILYELERRMEFFKQRAEKRCAELSSRKPFDETDNVSSRNFQPRSSNFFSVPNPEIRPMPLITTSRGSLTVNEEAVKKLRQIHGRIGVLAMVGTYRTGKSFILSRIMGEEGGFPVESKVRSCTHGIWIWGKHIEGTDNIDYLLVLDTEGLRDPMKGDKKHDTSIFALAMLLSSYLVYNAMNVIDFSAIRDLHLVANLHEHIRCRVQQDEKRVMPRFCWLVRDFSLNLEIDGKPCSEGEYLENALMLREERDPQANKIKRYLRDTFPDRHCVCLCKPTEDDEKIRQLDKQPYESLRHEFTSKLNVFINQMYKSVLPLTIMGQQLTGSSTFSRLIIKPG